jgi:formylglycine-generating enzyme required for sulfatase activity
MLELATGTTRSWTELNLVGDVADIPAGETEIGAADLDQKYGGHKPHRVRLSRPYKLAVVPTTNEKLRRFIAAEGGRSFGLVGRDAKTGRTYAPFRASTAESEMELIDGFNSPPFSGLSLSARQLTPSPIRVVPAVMEVRYMGLDGGFLGLQNPAVRISYEQVQAYCFWLNLEYQASDKPYGEGEWRIPTRAEWEHAMRAGRTEAQAQFPTSTGLLERGLGLFGGLMGANSTGPVGQFPANPWGLKKGLGSVLEWLLDYYSAAYYAQNAEQGVVTDPMGPTSGTTREISGGGAWRHSYPDYLRLADREGLMPDSDFRKDVGLRVGFFPV